MAWLTGWTYRKKITLTGKTGAGTNYQVKLLVGESSGATGENFDVENKSASFPSAENVSGDLRFTSSDGTTLLDFWVETVSGSTPNRLATVWVEVSADLGSNQDIYCYYGGTTTNVSNGINTFPVFEKFLDDPFSSRWSLETASSWIYDSTNDYIYQNGSSYNGKYVKKNSINILHGYSTRFKFRATRWGFNHTFYIDANNSYSFLLHNDFDNLRVYRNGSLIGSSSSFAFAQGTDYTVEWALTNGKIHAWCNGTKYLDGVTDSSPLSGNAEFRFVADSNTNDPRLYWVITRKFVDTEPSYNTAGSEEKFTAQPTISSKARMKSSGVFQGVSSKSRIETSGVIKTTTAKARVKNIGTAKTATAKAKIETGGTKEIQARADIKNIIARSIQAKADIKNTLEKTILVKGRIKSAGIIKSIAAKGRVTGSSVINDIQAKSTIKKLGVQKIISAKSLIKQLSVTNEIKSKAILKKTGIIKIINARGAIKHSGIVKDITAKSNVMKTGVAKLIIAKGTLKQANIRKSVTVRGRLKKSGVAKTLTAKAKIWGFPAGYVTMNRKQPKILNRSTYPKTLRDNRKI